ncbi:MAG: hypothetical protein SWE60_10035 [Thermodesulfobacteriota bacterium]|nr:hypothetical protein [Thermodesulfobacteriota bacterium]
MPYVSLEEPDKRRFAVDDPRGLISFEKIFGPEIEESFVIYSGEEKHIQKGITFLPWQELTFTETMGRCHE